VITVDQLKSFRSVINFPRHIGSNPSAPHTSVVTAEPSKTAEQFAKVPLTRNVQAASDQISHDAKDLFARCGKQSAKEPASQSRRSPKRTSGRKADTSSSPNSKAEVAERLLKLRKLFDTRQSISKADNLILCSILQQRLKPRDERKPETTRADVTVKKILRMMKHFYDLSINSIFNYKQKRSGKSVQQFLKYTDDFAKKNMRSDYFKLFGVTQDSISEHLAALVQPRSFLVEIENHKNDIDKLHKSRGDEAVAGCEPNSKTNENLVKSWTNPYRQYIERLSRVRELCEINRNLLYLKYNKVTFNTYVSRVGNLLLLEHFLQKLEQLQISRKTKVIIVESE